MRYAMTSCHPANRIQSVQGEVSEGSGQRVKGGLRIRSGQRVEGQRGQARLHICGGRGGELNKDT